ncbi:MAG: tRNA (N(6)-L-threonylcarbamoyladenosine(37)-C(2))-methylthiotransferase MtaB [Oscillospiraceae bacterium]
MLKVAFYTLGCKVNQNETGALARLFEENGFALADTDYADIYIVNSCTVTTGGDKKSLQWLRHAKSVNSKAITVLTGCYPQAFPDIAAQISEADIITGTSNRKNILNHVIKFIQNKEKIVDILPHTDNEIYEELPTEKLLHHTRAFIKIEDGCDRHCTYCVIPRARGAVRSRSEQSILNEVNELVSYGYKEMVITGVNLSSYGKDTNTSLEEIVVKIAKIDGVRRIRLGSLEPDLITDNFINALCKVDKLCRQFHLSLQSGCNATLKRMARLYTKEQFLSVVDKLRCAFPDAVFTTDIIVGFPMESDDDFNESLEIVQNVSFLKVHAFSYSQREGTSATKLNGQISENLKSVRLKSMIECTDTVREKVIKNMIGTSAQVLLEGPVNAHTFTGYTKSYVPILVKAQGHKVGDIINVQLVSYNGNRCTAKPI